MRVNIEGERAKRMMTKAAISTELGISQKTYMAYVLGKRSIPSNILLRMASLFGCSVDYLLQEEC